MLRGLRHLLGESGKCMNCWALGRGSLVGTLKLMELKRYVPEVDEVDVLCRDA